MGFSQPLFAQCTSVTLADISLLSLEVGGCGGPRRHRIWLFLVLALICHSWLLFAATDQPHPGVTADLAQQAAEPVAVPGEGGGGIQELPARRPHT